MVIQLLIWDTQCNVTTWAWEARNFWVHFLTPDQIVDFFKAKIRDITAVVVNEVVRDTKNDHPSSQDIYDMLWI